MGVKVTKNLTDIERYVLNVLESGAAKSNDLTKIAKLCHVTEVQVMVALQLLIHKKMLPTKEIL
jgi:hypothetical protein